MTVHVGGNGFGRLVVRAAAAGDGVDVVGVHVLAGAYGLLAVRV